MKNRKNTETKHKVMIEGEKEGGKEGKIKLTLITSLSMLINCYVNVRLEREGGRGRRRGREREWWVRSGQNMVGNYGEILQ